MYNPENQLNPIKCVLLKIAYYFSKNSMLVVFIRVVNIDGHNTV